MASDSGIVTFMETCRQFELGSDAPLQFRYVVTPAQDRAFVMIGGRDGTARLTWWSDGFVNIEAYTALEEIIFHRQFETKNGWEFLVPSLEELSLSLVRRVRQ